MAHRPDAAHSQETQFAEAQLRALIGSMPDLLWVKNVEGRYVNCNVQFERFFGTTRATILGKTDDEVLPPGDVAIFSIGDRDVLTSGVALHDEAWLTTLDGRRGFYETVRSPLLDATGRIVGILGIARDVSARYDAKAMLHRLNRMLSLMKACHQVLVRAKTEIHLAESICDLMVQRGGYALAWIGLAGDRPECRITPLASRGAVGYLDNLRLSWADEESGCGPAGTAIRENRVIWTRDTKTDQTFSAWRDKAMQFSLRSSIAIPLKGHNGTMGGLTIYSTVPDSFTGEEVELLVELANDLALGMQSLRASQERAVADARWKESNERLREISENIRDVFYLVTPDSSQFLYVSPAYEQVWGRPVAELYADPLSWSRAIHPEDRDAAVQLFLGGMTQGGFDAEYRISHPDGSTRWISTHGNPILDQNGSVVRVIGIAMDITEAKHSELENRRLADRLVTTMEIISDAMFTLDLEGQITYVNREVESQLGRARQDLLGKNFWDALPDVMGTITEYSFREARSSMKTIEFERYYDPLNKWFAARLYPHEEGTVAYFRDITDAKQAEEEYRRHTTRLQALSRRLFQAEEEERRRLGRELHDQAGANLTAMALSLELLRRRLPEPEDGEIGIWFREFDAILQDTIRHVRTVLTDLRPAALDDLGLLAALRHYVQRTLSLTSIKVQIEGTEPVPRLEPDVAIALFRVVQEALTNVVKHSQASLATISLMGASDRLTLTVEDNGLGFSHDSALKDTASLGMTTMQERVEAIGARLSVRSAPGHGTIVTIELPTKVAGQIVPDTAESAH